MSIPDGMMSTGQAAEFLGVDVRNVRAMIASGALVVKGEGRNGSTGRPGSLVAIVDVKKLKAEREARANGEETPTPKKAASKRGTPKTPASNVVHISAPRRIGLILDCAEVGIFTDAEALARIRDAIKEWK